MTWRRHTGARPFHGGRWHNASRLMAFLCLMCVPFPLMAAPSAGDSSGSEAPGLVEVSTRSGSSAADRAKMTGALLDEANQAYQQGNYQRAIELYGLVLDRGIRNGHIYFNLGNAWQRLGDTGHAVYYYLLAQCYLPRDGDVRANLAYARDQVEDRIAPESPPWWHRVMFWHDQVSDHELAIMTVVFNLLFWGFLAIARFGRRGGSGLTWAIALSGVLTLLAAVTAVEKVWTYTHHPVAVVLADEVSVRSGTDVNSVRLFILHAGAEVRIGQMGSPWVRVDLPDGKRGWVERRFLGIVSPLSGPETAVSSR